VGGGVSATAAAPTPSVRNDIAACVRYVASRLQTAARDPFALGVFAFAGLASVALWGFGLGIHPAVSSRYPWPGGWLVFSGPTPRLIDLVLFTPSFAGVVAQLLLAALVVWALDRPAGGLRPADGPALASLPVGPRARLLGDALVATLLTLGVRWVLLWLGGVHLGRLLYGFDTRFALFPDVAWLLLHLFPPGWPLRLAAYHSAFLVSSLLGGLLTLPLVLAWTTAGRLDGRGLRKPALAVALLFGALAVGTMSHLLSAGLVCLLISAFLLVRLDSGERLNASPARLALGFRSSPGPLAAFRRDAGLRLLETRWRLAAAAVLLPLLPALAFRAGLVGPAWSWPGLAQGAAFTVVLLQWLVLTALALVPFGIPILPAGTRPGALFSGALLASWRALPVRPEAVTRTVWLHGLLCAGLAWLVLLTQLELYGARLRPAWYALPVVFLLPALTVCEAVGDRRRGIVALAALVSYQLGPVFYAIARDGLGRPVGESVPGLTWFGSAVVLVGALPALVHLRGRPAPAGARRAA
jgi:hypothetical protein